MTKVAVTRMKGRAVAQKRVRGPGGQQIELYAVDSNDKNFDDDLTYVFQKNIARARRENKRKFGSSDGISTAGTETRKRSASLNGAARK